MKENKMRESFEELDLYAYLRVIWKWRWLIAIGVIVATLLSIPASYLVRSYESQGVLRVSEELKVTLPDYKIYSAAFMDSRTLLEYLKGQEVFHREEMAAIEEKLMAKPVLEAYLKPVYAYTQQEIRAPSPEDQFVSAVQLSWDDSSPQLAQRMVDAMGLFVKNIIEKKVMERYVTQGYQEAYAQVSELESKLSDQRFSLEQNEKKLQDLTKIAQHSSGTEQLTSREVVSVDQGGHRYLPPSTQRVATEVVISDTKLSIRDTERRLKINRVKLELFTRMKKALEAEDYSESLFEQLVGIKEEFFQGKDLTRDEILIVRNEVSTDFTSFEYRFHDVMQFVSGPTLPKRAQSSKRLVVAVTFFLGLFFFTLLSFFLEFIQQNQQRERVSGKRGTKKQT